MEKTLRVFNSFEEAEAADREYYQALTPEQRLQILFEIVAAHENIDGAPEARLQRVCRIVERRES